MKSKSFGAVLLACALVGCSDRGATPDATSAAANGETAATPAATPAAAAEPNPALVKSCNIETVDGTRIGEDVPAVAGKNTVRFTGWLIDEQSKAVPEQVVLRLFSQAGSREQPVVMWRARPDVAKSRGEGYLQSGFAVDVDLKDLASGDYAVQLGFSNGAGKQTCDIGRHVALATTSS